MHYCIVHHDRGQVKGQVKGQGHSHGSIAGTKAWIMRFLVNISFMFTVKVYGSFVCHSFSLSSSFSANQESLRVWVKIYQYLSLSLSLFFL